jgi:hypothetical protein
VTVDIFLAFGSFLAVLGACALAARQRPSLRPVPSSHEIQPPGKPGFLRRLAS